MKIKMFIINENSLNIKPRFDHYQFLASEDQITYFLNYLYTLVENKTVQARMPYIKRQLRCINWKALTSSGLLDPKFICFILTPYQMKEIYGFISDDSNASSIKILHYLDYKELASKYNLMQPYTEQNIYESDISEHSSNSINTVLSINDNSIQGTLLYRILQILHQDRFEYSSKIKNIRDENNNFIFDTDNANGKTEDAYIFDDYVERYSNQDKTSGNINITDEMYDTAILAETTTITTTNPQTHQEITRTVPYRACYQTNNRYQYTPRISSYGYYIDTDENPLYLNPYHEPPYDSTQIIPILNYHTFDRIFKERFIQTTYEYIYDEYGNEQSIAKTISISKAYIADTKRSVGLDRIELIKHQQLPLSFVCQYYTLDQICQYYKFTVEELAENKNGLNINGVFTQWTSKSLEILFKYQLLNILNDNYTSFNQDFDIFYNTNKSLLTDKALKYLCVYQKITDYQGNLNPVFSQFSEYSNNSLTSLCSKAYFEDLYDNVYYNTDVLDTQFDVQQLNTYRGVYKAHGVFIKELLDPVNNSTLILNGASYSRNVDLTEYNYTTITLSNHSSYLYETINIDNSHSNDSNHYSKKTDNVIVYNMSDADKKVILEDIRYRYIVNKNISHENNSIYEMNYMNDVDVHIPYLYKQYDNVSSSIIKQDANNRYYLDLCVRKYNAMYSYYDNNQEQFLFVKSALTGENILNPTLNKPIRYSVDSKYFTVGIRPLLVENTNSNYTLRTKVYLCDVIAILANRLIVASKLYIYDTNRDDNIKYSIVPTQTSEMFIIGYEQQGE